MEVCNLTFRIELHCNKKIRLVLVPNDKYLYKLKKMFNLTVYKLIFLVKSHLKNLSV